MPLELRGGKSRDIEVPSGLMVPKARFLSLLSKFSHQNTVHCVGLSLQTAPPLILLELMSGEDMKSFLRHSRPHSVRPFSQPSRPLKEPVNVNLHGLMHLCPTQGQLSPLAMQDLL